MSKFSTHIPVDVEAVTKTLPEGSHVSSIRLSDDKRSIVLEWENDHHRTPYTFAVEVSPEQLASGEPLPHVKKAAGLQRVQNDVVETPVAPQAKQKAKTPKVPKTPKAKKTDEPTPSKPVSEPSPAAGS